MATDPDSASGPPAGIQACEAHLRPLILARNASGIRRLAEQHDVSNDELAAYVRGVLEAELADANPERIGPRFDIHTAQYITLAEWAERFLSSL